jgi:hypothetical protein
MPVHDDGNGYLVDEVGNYVPDGNGEALTVDAYQRQVELADAHKAYADEQQWAQWQAAKDAAEPPPEPEVERDPNHLAFGPGGRVAPNAPQPRYEADGVTETPESRLDSALVDFFVSDDGGHS